MATMLDGESYLGRVLIRPLSKSGGVTLFLWPLRCLNGNVGGPTFGVDTKGEEILRFDMHGPRGHWHKGYDKLGIGGSEQHFPEALTDTESQIAWSLTQLRENGRQLLTDLGYLDEAGSLDQNLVNTAAEDVIIHLEKEGDVRSKAIDQGLIEA